MCRLDDAIEKLENGSDIKDVIDAMDILALEIHDLKETHYGRHTSMPARS